MVICSQLERNVETKTSELEILEELILNYKKEKDTKKKHVLYLSLVVESLKLVKKIAAMIYPIPSTVSRDDLVQVGAIGVLKAIDTYKSEEKGSFKTYVSKYIKGKILHYLRDKANIVKTPRETITNITKVRNAISELSGETSETPSVEEVANFINLPKDKVEEIMNAETMKNTISLDQKIFSADGAESMLDTIQDDGDKNYEQIYEDKKIIEFALNKLPKTEKEVIYKYYIEGITQKDIAKNLGISAMQVSRIIKRALNKMYIIIENDKED